MSLLLPSALLALLALALPLLIHLQRRRETPPPRLFAALAYIDPQARPKQRLRLRDLVLLLLRLLLLALLAFVLAQPLLQGRAGAPWVLLWPGLDPAQVGSVPDGAELRWLAPGFPRVDVMPAPVAEAPFSLLRQLAFERPREQAIEVRVPREIEGWDGVSLQLGRAIEWTVLPVELPAAPREPQVLRVAVQTMDEVENEQRQALAALRAYFEGLAEATPLQLIEAGEALPANGVEALWVIASTKTIPQQHTAESAQARSVEHAEDDEARREDSAPGAAVGADAMGAASAGQGSGDRGERAAPVGQDPPYGIAERALGSLSPAWRVWLREGGRALVSGLDTSETRPPQFEPAAAEAAALAALDVRAHMIWRGEHASLRRVLIDGAELRLLDCPLDARCLPELLAPDFPRLLQSWLEAESAPASRIDASLIAPSADGLPPQPAGTPLRDALILVLLLLLLAERWLAATRRPA
jgi:hypothetical protein